MNTVTVTVRGMGLTIGNEIELIKNVLKEYGYDVTVNDEYPPEKPMREDFNGKGRKVIIKADHLPWPG